MTDDIYEHIRFDGDTAPHLLAAAPGAARPHAGDQRRLQDLRDDRLAHRLGRRPARAVRALDTFLSQAAGNACSVSQAAAAAALTGDQSFVAESVATYRERRDATAAGINAIPGLVLPRAGGRLLPLRQLRRTDRPHDARRQPARDGWRRRHVPARARRRRRRRRARPMASRPTSACRSRPRSTPSTTASPASPAPSRNSRLTERPHDAIEKQSVRPAGRPRRCRERLRGIAVALLSDQLHRNRGFSKGLRPYHSPAPLAGTAVTVRTRGGDNLAILRAYELLPARRRDGRGCRRRLDNALVGGIMTF